MNPWSIPTSRWGLAQYYAKREGAHALHLSLWYLILHEAFDVPQTEETNETPELEKAG